jgi:acetolactate synthase I/II/III large subunit
MSEARTGARALLEAAHTLGVRVCFANPGTTELALVRALDEVPGIRAILGMFEGVCTGAADGYARVSGQPALTLLHLGPGLANGLANLHNARRAHSPIINIVGDHATWHLRFDAPLTSDIESLAEPMSARVIRLDSSAHIAPSVREAVAHSLGPPGGVVTLIAPSDLMESPIAAREQESLPEQPSAHAASSRVAQPGAAQAGHPVSKGRIEAAAKELQAGDPATLLLGSDALSERGQRAASQISRSTGARLLMESYPAIVPLGGDLPRLERLAYFPDDVLKQLGDGRVVLAGARAPVSYFGYPGQPSELVQPQRLVELSAAGDDTVLALEQLAERLRGASRQIHLEPTPTSQAEGTSELSPAAIAEALVQQLPEGAIVSLEGSTAGGPFLQRAHRARRHRVMTNTGGAIGQGLPCAVGAAVAAPDARVICLQSDGSAQYTVQSLWTMAREGLNVTVIICANHRYGILQTELRRSGASLDQGAIASLTRLDSPRVDWVALAKGYGVMAWRCTSAEEFQQALARGLGTSGPCLIAAELG